MKLKKWLIALCCVLVAAAIAIVTILNNSNSRIDTLNQDLGNIQAEYNTLKEKNEKDEQTIQDLNHQVTELTTEKDRLTAENGQLNETLEGLNRNLSSSQQKLQGVMYILTDGAQGNIESILSPYKYELAKQPKKIRMAWYDYALRFCEKRDYLTHTEHLMIVSRKG